MGKQTSRMYGIKVKEKINYYDFGDICISFENNVWTVKAGFHDSKTTTYHDVSWWLNGVEYGQGDTIVTFNEGDEVVYKIMEQHTDTVPYVNYFYDIYGNASENVEYGNKEISYRITGNGGDTYSFKIYTLENGIIKSTKVIRYKDIQKNKELFDKDALSVYNMLVKWHGMNPESGYLQMSFELISNSNYISDLVGNAYPKNVMISNFQADNFLGLALKDDTNKHEAKRVDKDVLPSVKLIKRLGGSTICEATKDKKTIYSDKFYDHMDVYYNGKWHDAMYLVYDSPQEEGCWVGKGDKLIGTTDLALTYADPYWFLMTLKSGIEYGGNTYEAKKLIRVWKPETVVNMTLKRVTSRNKYKVTKDDYETIIYGIETVVGEGSLVLTKSETANDDSTTLYPSDCPTDFYGLTIDIDGNDWVIISKDGHIKYNKKTYGKNSQIVSFNRNDDIHITMDDDGNRYQAQKEIKANYETILYYIQMSSANPDVTVTKQIMTENTNTESGKTEKVYTDIESRTITPSDSPCTFYNIQFKINNAQTVWTVYSKCRYISYGGRNYPINRSIIDLPTNEDVTIEIKDESNKYEVQQTCTYYIKTPDADTTVDYEIHTAENTLDMKIVKTDGETEEPWVTVKFYEAMYAPFEFEDVSLKFYNNTMEWELFSNSDKLYYRGTLKKKGESLGTWRYADIVKFDSIVVTHPNTEALEIKTKFTSTSSFVRNDEVDASIDWSGFDEEEDFHLSYNPGTGLWTIKNGNKIAYHSGLQYMSRQVILQFKTKTIVEDFDIAYREPDEHGVYTYKIYHISSDIDIKGITSVNVSLSGHNSETFFDKNLNGEYDTTRLLTKDAAKSLYGYIWKRDRGPGPTPPSQDPDIIIYVTYASYSSGSGVRGRLLGITNSANFTVQTLIDRTGSSSNYPSIRYAKGNRLYVNPLYYTDDFGHTAMKSFTPQFSPVYYLNGYPVDFNTSETPNVTSPIVLDKYKYAFLITGESLNYSDHLITYEIDLLGRLTRISDDLIYEAEDRPVNNLINQITSGNNNNFDYYFGAAFSKSGYRPDPYYGPVLVSWTEYSILNDHFQSVVDNPFDSAFGSLYNQYHIFDHYNPWVVDPQGNPVPVYEGVEFSKSESISGYGWTDLKEQTQWHHYNQSNTQDDEDDIVPRTMYTSLGVMYNWFHLRRRYYEQTGPDAWRILYQDLGWYYSIYDVNTGSCFINAYSYDYSDMQRALDIVGRVKLFKGDAYSFEIVDNELHILQVSRTNPFIWQVVKSKDVGSTVNLKLYTNRSGSSTFVTVTLGVNQLYNSSNRTCGIVPFNTAVGGIYSGSNGGAINSDNYWRYRVRIDGYQNKYINLVFDNPYFDGGGLGFAFLDDI